VCSPQPAAPLLSAAIATNILEFTHVSSPRASMQVCSNTTKDPSGPLQNSNIRFPLTGPPPLLPAQPSPQTPYSRCPNTPPSFGQEQSGHGLKLLKTWLLNTSSPVTVF
jgi:hypothetical protein